MNAYATANQAYREQSILTAPPEQLVLMLCDGVRRFLFQAASAMRGGAVSTSNERLQRAEAIIDELLATLDPSAGEIAERLRALYLFSKRHLMEGRVERDPEKLDAISGIFLELREAWAGVCSPAAQAS